MEKALEKKVIIYGLGNNFAKSIDYLKQRYEIIGCSDSDSKKKEIAKAYGFQFISPANISENEYDYIVVTSIYGESITDFLTNECGICKEAILRREIWSKIDFKTSFGDKNPEKVFYLMSKSIRRNNGLMSLLYMYLCQMSMMDLEEYIPVVDLQTYDNQYLEKDEIGEVNAIEKFFEPLTPYSVNEVFESKNVILGYDDPGYLWNFFDDYELSKLSKVYKKYFRIKKDIRREIDEQYINIIGGRRNVMGVLYRGTDMTELKLPYHMIQPSLSELFSYIDDGLSKWNCEYIYVSTEDEEALKLLKDRYPGKILCTNQKRYSELNGRWIAEVQNNRDNDAFLRGFEYLSTISILSRCDYLVSGIVAGSIAALIMNDGAYVDTVLINKGQNIPHMPDYNLIKNHVHRENEIIYRKKYENSPLENIIVFRSGPHEDSYVPGMDYGDNARALFEYMLEAHLDDKYELIWLVMNPAEYTTTDELFYLTVEGERRELSQEAVVRNRSFAGRNVSFIGYYDALLTGQNSEETSRRDAYFRAICLAKYIFMTDAYGFAGGARPDQTRIQLWHGCGFKTRINFASCENRYEYNIVISELYKKVHKKIYGLRDDQVVITGYPKQDWIYKPYESDLSELLNINKADEYILWLPTFRMAKDQLSELNQYELPTETGLPIVVDMNQMKRLNKYLKQNKVALIIKLHPFQKRGLVQEFDCSNIHLLYDESLYEKDILLNRLMGNTSALISDYSSAAVDYLNTGKPIGFTIDDMEEYKTSRGFVFDDIENYLPGMEIRDFENLLSFVKEVTNGSDHYGEKRRRVSDVMLKFRDGGNCKRVCERFGIIP